MEIMETKHMSYRVVYGFVGEFGTLRRAVKMKSKEDVQEKLNEFFMEFGKPNTDIRDEYRATNAYWYIDNADFYERGGYVGFEVFVTDKTRKVVQNIWNVPCGFDIDQNDVDGKLTWK